MKWAGGGQGSLETEGDGVGMIRHMEIPGVGKMAERLDRLEAQTSTLGYTLVYGNPIGMADYRAVVRLEPLDQAHCRIHWHGEFQPAAGEDVRIVADNLENSYRGMSDALVAFVGSD